MSATAIPSPNPTSYAWNVYLDNQPVNLTAIDGSTVTVSLEVFKAFGNALNSSSVIYGFGIGFCGMLSIVLILLTDGKKLRRPIYLLNLASLIIYTFRSIVAAIIDCTIGGSVAQNLLVADAYPMRHWWATFTGLVVQIFLYFTICLSLVLQVRVVFAAEPRTQKIVTAILGGGGLGMVVLETIFCIDSIVDTTKGVGIDFPWNDYLYFIQRIYFCIFVGLSCLVFLYKLAVTIYRRRKMGIKKFGPLQIIFIMFSQCLVVPLLFYILQLSGADTTFNFTALGQVFLVCTLPLSALWASADAESRRPEAPSFANMSGTDSANSNSVAGKFSLFSGKKSAQESHSSYDTDIEKAPDYSHDVHTTHHVVAEEPNSIPEKRGY